MPSIKLKSIKNLQKDVSLLNSLYFEDIDEIEFINFEEYFSSAPIFYKLIKGEDEITELYNTILDSSTSKKEITDKLSFVEIDDCEVLIFYDFNFIFVFTNEFFKEDVENLLTTLI